MAWHGLLPVPITNHQLPPAVLTQGVQYMDHRGWLCWQLNKAIYNATDEDTILSDLFTDVAAEVEREVLGGGEPAAPLGRISVINVPYHQVFTHAFFRTC